MVHGVAKSQARDTTKWLSVHTPCYCPLSPLEVGSSKCVLEEWTAGRRPGSQTSWWGGPWTNRPSARKSSNTRPPGWLWGCCPTASCLLSCNQTSYSCLFLSSCFDLPIFRMISFTMSSCPFSSEFLQELNWIFLYLFIKHLLSSYYVLDTKFSDSRFWRAW